MKRLSIFLLTLSLFACKKPGYQPCDCIPALDEGSNTTVISGLYFGSTWDEVAASGVFDTLIHFDNDHLSMPCYYGGLPADIFLGFDYMDGLVEIKIRFPYGRISEDSISIYESAWRACIDSVYGDGCFQRFQLLHGWSKEGLWQWDMCGGAQLTQLWNGVVSNQWHPVR